MEQTSFINSMIAAFQTGGAWMIPIAISLAVSVALTIERAYRLYIQYNVDGASFMFEVQKYILANDIDGAIRLCNGGGNKALAKVIKAGLQRASRDENQIQNAIDATSLEMIPKLERRLPYLALIANIATLLGLLGTISGLIKSFAAIAQADPAQRQAILSAGISEAMNATAFGLITAIFTMIAHSILSNQASRLLEEIDEFGVKLLDLLSARKYRQGAQKAE
ncbi:MAG: MotA/TolQ/ExbB proton channel family protein [Oligoflexia bacterium]|nr:MotA/TolQ/ExbB proton channel family protein [Oligoflexia bacterium]